MNRKWLWIFFIAIMVTPVAVYTASKNNLVMKTYLSRWETMSLDKAKKKWGEKTFDSIKFKNGNLNDRSPMVVDLIKSKQFIGADSNVVREKLGPYTGYFWSDTIPAYIIEQKSKTNPVTWQLVFLIDENWKITEVRIQNNVPRL
jgi:hypothetical protein